MYVMLCTTWHTSEVFKFIEGNDGAMHKFETRYLLVNSWLWQELNLSSTVRPWNSIWEKAQKAHIWHYPCHYEYQENQLVTSILWYLFTEFTFNRCIFSY